MSSFEPPITDAARESAIEAQRRRTAQLQLIRAMPTSQYIAMQTAEVLAAALCVSPALAPFWLVNGLFAAKYPATIPGAPPPPVPVCVMRRRC